VRAPGIKATWLTLKRSLITIYNDVFDEHLFVFAAGLSYYLVLSLFPLLVTIASLKAIEPWGSFNRAELRPLPLAQCVQY
jgi:uncharacterized BrkB/YihY/UPF0761 family membrane protein